MDFTFPSVEKLRESREKESLEYLAKIIEEKSKRGCLFAIVEEEIFRSCFISLILRGYTEVRSEISLVGYCTFSWEEAREVICDCCKDSKCCKRGIWKILPDAFEISEISKNVAFEEMKNLILQENMKGRTKIEIPEIFRTPWMFGVLKTSEYEISKNFICSWSDK